MFAKWFTPLAPPFSIIPMSKDPRSMKSQMHQKTFKKVTPLSNVKGQLFSKCPFGVTKLTKKTNEIVCKDFCPNL
jgi:hypothetical protein